MHFVMPTLKIPTYSIGDLVNNSCYEHKTSLLFNTETNNPAKAGLFAATPSAYIFYNNLHAFATN
jgi:hypothetical protein